MDQKKWELLTKLKKYHRETALYEQQLKSATGIRTNYASLLRIEELKLGQGESSLFLINARENKMLEIDQKLIELRLKYLKSFYAIDWSAGVLR